MQQREREPNKTLLGTYINIYLLNSILLHHIVILFAIDIVLKSNSFNLKSFIFHFFSCFINFS